MKNSYGSSLSDKCEQRLISSVLPKNRLKHKNACKYQCSLYKRLIDDESDQSSSSKDDERFSFLNDSLRWEPSLRHDIPMYYIVPICNGKKQGYGEIHFGGEYDALVYSTSWINDIRSNKGFVYNRITSKVLCLVDDCERQWGEVGRTVLSWFALRPWRVLR